MGAFAGTEFKPPVQIDIQALSLIDCDALHKSELLAC